jgi:hypothetical protein
LVAAPIIIRLVRILAFAGGISCLYAGTLLYEDELGRVQNKLEEWWVRFDDQQRVALSKAALFMRATVTLTGRLLDGIFGEELISFRSLSVSTCFSLASMLLVFSFLNYHYQAEAAELFNVWTIVAIILIVLGVLSARYRLARVSTAGLVVLLFVMFLFASEGVGIGFVLVLAASLFSDIAFVTLTRRLLRWTEELTLATASIVVFIADSLLGILLFLGPLSLFPNLVREEMDPSQGTTVSDVVLYIGSSNGLAFLLSAFLTFVAFFLLLHRMLWPMMTRFLYVVAPSRTQKVLLVLVGTSLLSFALGKPLSDEAKELIKGLSGAA